MDISILDKVVFTEHEITKDKEIVCKRVNPPKTHSGPKCVRIKKIVVKYLKQNLIELKDKIEKSIIIAEDFNNLFLTIDRTTKAENKNIAELNNTSNQKDLINFL